MISFKWIFFYILIHLFSCSSSQFSGESTKNSSHQRKDKKAETTSIATDDTLEQKTDRVSNGDEVYDDVDHRDLIETTSHIVEDDPPVATEKEEYQESEPKPQTAKDEFCNQQIAVAVTLDLSLSMRSSLEASKAAVIQFINTLESLDEMSFITFNSSPTVQSYLSPNHQQVVNSVQNLDRRSAAFGTNITTALETSARVIGATTISKKVVILFSDGKQFAAGERPEFYAQRLKETGIEIFTIGFNTGREGAATLTTIASDPSYYYEARDSSIFERIYLQISETLCR